MKKYYKTIGLVGLLIYRVFLLISGSFFKSLRMDEGYSNLTSLIISQKGIPLYDSGHWDGSYLYFHYLQAGVFKLLGYSDGISRILPIIFGIISLFFIYKISKSVYENKYVAGISVFLTAFSYYFEVAVTQARYYSMLMMLYLAGIYFIIKFYKNQTFKKFFIALNIAFLAIIFHIYLYSLLVILLFVLILIFWEKNDFYISKIKNLFKDLDKKNIIILFGILLNFVVFYFLMTSLNPGQTTGAVKSTFQYIAFDYLNNYINYFVYTLGALFVFVYIGLANIYFAKNKSLNAILLLAFFFPFLVISKYVFMFATRYIFFLIPLIVIIGVGTMFVYYQKFNNKYLKYSYLAVIIVLLFLTVKVNFDYKNPLYINDISSPEPNFKGAYEFIKSNEDFSSGANIISAFPHMDYLYLGKSDYYIYIDETGVGLSPDKSFYIKNGKNIFTNAIMLTGLDNLKNIQKQKTSYIILDQLSIARLKNTDMLNYIKNNYSLVFEDKRLYNIIDVYKRNEK